MSINRIKQSLNTGFRAFWVQNWRVSVLCIGLIIGLGIISLIQIPKESTPDINFGIIGINTFYMGVNPTDIDQLITHDIEQAIKEVDGIKKITSTSKVGLSSITIELDNDANVNDTLTKIRTEVDKVNLPSGAEDPVVTEISMDSTIMFELILYAPRELASTMSLKKAARTIQQELEGKGSINTISIDGSDAFDVQVVLDRAKMENMHIDIQQVVQTIQAFNQNIPLGNYEIGDLQYDFRIAGELEDPFALLDLRLIGVEDEIRLKDIADLTFAYDDERGHTYGEREDVGYISTKLTFTKQKDMDIFSAASQAKQAVEDLLATQQFSIYKHSYTQDISELIKEDYANLASSGIQTLVFVFICLVFFVGLKESAIATIAIPLAFMVTFIVLNNMGSSLNFMTNFSLVLSLGIAIDTTIVIIEGASENLKLGFTPKSAILKAVRDYHKPLIAGTMTTIVVFIPMMILPGIIGKFLAFIPITVFFTLLAALFISLTLNSALFYKLSKNQPTYHTDSKTEKFLTPEDQELLAHDRQGKQLANTQKHSRRERFLENLNTKYEAILRKFLGSKKNRRRSIFLPIIVLFLSFMLPIGFTLFPQSDNSTFAITITASPGTTTSTMEGYVDEVEIVISTIPELKHFTTTTDNNTLQVNVDLLDKHDRQDADMRDVFTVEADTLEELSVLEQHGLKVSSLVEGGGPPIAKPVGLKLIAQDARDFDILLNVAEDFETYLLQQQGLKNINISSQKTPGQFVFHFNHDKLRSLGLTPNDIVGGLTNILNGGNAGSLAMQGKDRDIKVVYKDMLGNISPSTIESLTISTKAGPIVVGEVLDYEVSNAVGAIAREDTKVLVRVDADLEEDYLGQGSTFQSAYEERASTYDLPPGIRYEAAGEQQENAELISATVQGFIISFFLIFGILVLQFNSFGRPLVIMYSVLCALLGVNIGLWLTGNQYSMTFAIGFIALTGIVVNDAIILIDRIQENISHDIDTFEAIVEAGRSRLQPIILTTLTTLLGILPISLQDKFWAGLGFTVIFGLFAGSAMTLFVIPGLYHTLFVKKKKKKKQAISAET